MVKSPNRRAKPLGCLPARAPRPWAWAGTWLLSFLRRIDQNALAFNVADVASLEATMKAVMV